MAVSSCDDDHEVVASPWGLVEASGDQLVVLVSMGGDPDCERFDHLDVVETASTVSITAWVELLGADVCDDSGLLYRAVAELDAPLGDRSLEGCLPAGDRPDFTPHETCADPVDGGP